MEMEMEENTATGSSGSSRTSVDEEVLESMISGFDQIYHEYKQGMATIQALQSSYNSEIQKRQALQFSVDSLRSENERLSKMYINSINKLADQLERQTNCERLKEELNKAAEEHTRREKELRNAMALLKQDQENRNKHLETEIREFVVQKAQNELTISQLHQSLAAHRNHIQALASRLEQVHSDTELRYKSEIQDLKDCLMVEQEEKNGLTKKLHILEKELLISRAKLAENQQDFTSNRHVETLKQKIMKLRKENEVLKRQLHDSKEE